VVTEPKELTHDPVFNLSGKIILVTGASRGLGKAMSVAFAQRGATLVLVSRKQEELDATLAEVRPLSPESIAVAGNLGRRSDIHEVAALVQSTFGRLDVLVNNAATNPAIGGIEEIPESAWDKVIEVNLTGPFVLSRAVLPLMKPGSTIINIASGGAFKAWPRIGAYCVSKAGLVMLTKVCAAEWAPKGIRTNALAPGLFKTDMAKALWKNPDEMSNELDKRIGMPDELVGAAVFLASDASSYVNGQTFIISPRPLN
jgi:NAD(P)-dependent dehydrogenase (short-subunit alcohol dehydrogenase family)